MASLVYVSWLDSVHGLIWFGLIAEKKKLGALLSVVTKSKINISYEALERATDYFHTRPRRIRFCLQGENCSCLRMKASCFQFLDFAL